MKNSTSHYRIVLPVLVSVVFSLFTTAVQAPATNANNIVDRIKNVNFIKNYSFEEQSHTEPNGWNKGTWGNNTATFAYPVAGFDSSKAARVEIRNYKNGDAKWYFNDVPVVPKTRYTFSDYYKSNTYTEVVARYTDKNRNETFEYIGTIAPSQNWKKFETTLITPSGIQSLTIFHLLERAGWLEVDNYKLNLGAENENPEDPSPKNPMISFVFDDGWDSGYQNAAPLLDKNGFKGTFYIVTETYKEEFDAFMTGNQILNLQSRKHEVGAHTRTHADLTLMSAAEARDEISGSRQDLLTLGIRNVRSFAYPYGSYNDSVKTLVRDAGFDNARSIIEGLNFMEGLDPLLLKWRGPQRTTSVAQIKMWVDEAIETGGWLILSFHEINNSGNQYSTLPGDFKQIVEYVNSKDIQVVTVSQGFDIINDSNQTIPSPKTPTSSPPPPLPR